MSAPAALQPRRLSLVFDEDSSPLTFPNRPIPIITSALIQRVITDPCVISALVLPSSNGPPSFPSQITRLADTIPFCHAAHHSELTARPRPAVNTPSPPPPFFRHLQVGPGSSPDRGAVFARQPTPVQQQNAPGERFYQPFRPNANGGPNRISVLAGGRSGRAKLLLSRIPVAPQEYLQQRVTPSSVQRLGRSLALPSLCRRHSQTHQTHRVADPGQPRRRTHRTCPQPITLPEDFRLPLPEPSS